MFSRSLFGAAGLLLVPAILSAVTIVVPSTNVTTANGASSFALTFDLAVGQIQVTVDNTYVNPTSRGQLISGVSFAFSNGAGGTLTAATPGVDFVVASFRNIASGGVWSTVPAPLPADLHWEITNSVDVGGLLGIRLCNINCFSNPEQLIIGDPNASNLYSNANSSIINGNPSMFEPIFTLQVPGLTVGNLNDAVLLSYTVFFGSNAQPFTFYTPDCIDCGPNQVPEPGTYGLLGASMIALYALRRWRR